MGKAMTMSKAEIIAEPGIPQIIMSREFAAPRELLFRAYTETELLKQWLGPRRLTMIVDEYDVRDGGRWRYIHRDTDGAEYGFHGVFHGTPSLEDGIVQTFEFEGMPGHVELGTVTFEQRGDKTIVRSNEVYQSVEDRDAAMESGMEGGVHEGNERLDELLARMRQ